MGDVQIISLVILFVVGVVNIKMELDGKRKRKQIGS